ncbi:MAG: DNA double-strand break repair nuclease NurA [Actinomycetota bacterium]
MVETWDPAYGIAAAESTLEPASGPVDAAVELALDRWEAITPPLDADPAGTVAFVDGVRRIDTRVWIESDDGAHPAVCATVAAGAVVCTGARAEVTGVEVRRGLFTAVGGAEPIGTRHGCYDVVPARGDDDAALYLSVHSAMAELEAGISAALDDVDLVIFDGPLRGRSEVDGVGYIKTQHRQYLEPEQFAVVAGLGPGQRTPLFAVEGRSPLWSWYLRLPGPIGHSLAGIVRLELPRLGDVSDAAARADRISRLLPRFASEPHKDPRAPQNLHPIAGLERRLHHRLGDVLVLERALRQASMSSAA